jgi:hypothetical protein
MDRKTDNDEKRARPGRRRPRPRGRVARFAGIALAWAFSAALFPAAALAQSGGEGQVLQTLTNIKDFIVEAGLIIGVAVLAVAFILVGIAGSNERAYVGGFRALKGAAITILGLAGLVIIVALLRGFVAGGGGG